MTFDRMSLFNAIMYDKGGMSRTERELGAIGASMVNRCVYCAAVHADRHAKLSKSTEVTDKLLARGFNAELSPRDAAIFDFARKLSESPPQASADDVAALQKVGLRVTCPRWVGTHGAPLVTTLNWVGFFWEQDSRSRGQRRCVDQAMPCTPIPFCHSTSTLVNCCGIFRLFRQITGT